MNKASARAVVLALTGLVFVLVAAMTLVDPPGAAAGVGLMTVNVDGQSEQAAVYVGLWLAQAGLCAWAIARRREPLLGDVVALLVAGQVVGRLVASVRFGPPDQLLGAFVLEAVAVGLLVVLRPAPLRS